MKLTIGETAKLLGYNRSYFSTRRNQFDDFGPPSEEIGGKTKFDHEEVIKWAGENGVKVDQKVLDELLFAYGERVRDRTPSSFISLEGEDGYQDVRNPEVSALLHMLHSERHSINRLFSHLEQQLKIMDKKLDSTEGN